MALDIWRNNFLVMRVVFLGTCDVVIAIHCDENDHNS